MSLNIDGSSVEVETGRCITSPDAAIEVMRRMDCYNFENPMLVVGLGHTAIAAHIPNDYIVDAEHMGRLTDLDEYFSKP